MSDEMSAFARDLGRIEGTLKGIDEKINTFLSANTAMGRRVTDLEKRVTAIETESARLKSMIYGGGSVLCALWAAFNWILPYLKG